MKLTACEVDLAAALVRRDGEELTLTPTEVKLLRWFAERPGRALPREALLTEVWGYAPGVESRAPDNTIGRLRGKIEVDPKRPDHLLKVYGVGYRFEYTPESPEAPEASSTAPPPAPAQHHDVDPLALFLERARRVRWDFSLSPEELAPVRALVSGPLACNPLAITLAASQAGRLPALAIAERLSHHLRLHRSSGPVAGVLAWSRSLLQPPESAALRQCAVFRGAFTLEAAEAVLELRRWPESWALDVLQTLRDLGLLQLTPAPSPVPRFALLEPLQAAVRAELRADSAYSDTVERHLSWCARFAREALSAPAPDVASLRVSQRDLTAAATRAIAIGKPALADAAAWCCLGLRAVVTSEGVVAWEALRMEVRDLPGLSDATRARLISA